LRQPLFETDAAFEGGIRDEHAVALPFEIVHPVGDVIPVASGSEWRAVVAHYVQEAVIEAHLGGMDEVESANEVERAIL